MLIAGPGRTGERRKNMNQINDPGVPPEEWLAALRVVAGQESFSNWVVESNNHIHTCYSLNPRLFRVITPDQLPALIHDGPDALPPPALPAT